MSAPEFQPGEIAMIICPCGPPPWPEGPVTILNCTHFDPDTLDSSYAVLHENGRIENVDGVEIMSFDDWVVWMEKHAN